MAHLDPIYAPWEGNAEALASDIGVGGVTVRQWRNRGNIPPQYWRRIIEAAEKRGKALTLDQFAAVAEQADCAVAPVWLSRRALYSDDKWGEPNLSARPAL
jgi:hypothetical protein